MKNVREIQKCFVGTWEMPETLGHFRTISLHHDKTMRLTMATRTTGARIKQQFAGEVATGTWRVESSRPAADAFGGSARIAGSVSSSFSPPLDDASRPTRTPADGPFLVLTVNDLPKAMANVTIFGLKLDIANWIGMLDELRGGYYFRVVDVNGGARARLVMKDEVEVAWERVK